MEFKKFEKRTIIIDSGGNAATLYATGMNEVDVNITMSILTDDLFIDMDAESKN